MKLTKRDYIYGSIIVILFGAIIGGYGEVKQQWLTEADTHKKEIEDLANRNAAILRGLMERLEAAQKRCP